MIENNTYFVIMAGGIGSRFWPMSKKSKPKQFIDIFNTGKSLIQETFIRAQKNCKTENIYVVTNYEYKNLVKDQLPDIEDHQILCEPTAKNTAPCIGYAINKIHSQNKNAVVIVTPSDHYIVTDGIYSESIDIAVKYCDNNTSDLVTLGIKPSRPDIGYGYIQIGAQVESDSKVHKIKTFSEKPTLEIALQFIESGEFYWNSGMFIASSQAWINEFETYLPEMQESFLEIVDSFYTDNEFEEVKKIYAFMPNISIDYAIMENTKNGYIIPSDFIWSDVGTWNALYEIGDKNEDGNNTKGDFILLKDTQNSIVHSYSNQVIATNGVSNLIIVESDGIILIADRKKEQEIKELVNEVKQNWGDRFV